MAASPNTAALKLIQINAVLGQQHRRFGRYRVGPPAAPNNMI